MGSGVRFLQVDEGLARELCAIVEMVHQFRFSVITIKVSAEHLFVHH